MSIWFTTRRSKKRHAGAAARVHAHSVGGKTRKELDAYIAGNDPVTKMPFMQEVVDQLTRPLNDEEKKTGVVKREKKRFIGPDTADNIPEVCLTTASRRISYRS